MAKDEPRDPARQVEAVYRELREVAMRSRYAVAAKDAGKLERLNTLHNGLVRDLLYWKGRVGLKGGG